MSVALCIWLLAGAPGAGIADEPLIGGETPVPLPAEIAPEPTPLDLGILDPLHEEPGLKWWLIDTAVITAVSWSATFAFNERIREGVINSSGKQWLENISQPPKWKDGSDTVTNWVAHPLLGATWFLAYRSRGHGVVASSLGLIFQSLILEYAIEGPYNVPSIHDMVVTPLLGIPIGWGLDTLSVYLLKKEEKPLRYLGYLFNPFHLLPSAKKYRWAVSIDPMSRNFGISGRF